MQQEQEQKNNSEKKPPLIKIVPDQTISWSLKLGFLACVAIIVLMYVLGMCLKNLLWTMAAFVTLLIFIIVFIYIQRKKSLARRIVSSDAIENEVEQYKKDLIDTYNGYDVSYSKSDIQQAADEYQKKLELRYASVLDINVSTAGNIINTLRLEHSANKAVRNEAKQMMKMDKKAAKTQKKSKKKDKE